MPTDLSNLYNISKCFFFLFPGGMCFAYNCDLYYRDYFPDYDLGWWLFAVTIVIGSIGVVVGGIVSDKFVAKMGIRSRVACLAISQIIATPFAFGSVYFNPLWAMITLGISYFFGKHICIHETIVDENGSTFLY